MAVKATAPVNPDKAIRIARSWAYPKQVCYLVASFIFLIALCHYLSLGHRYLTRKRVYASAQRKGASLRRLPLAIADSANALAFRWTIPIGKWYTLNLAEVGVTAAYVAALLSWTFVNTTTTTGIPVEAHYYANRAGTIAASQLPLLTALGMRNNLISWLTGISFDKLNFLHRMAARGLCLLVWIHAGGRLELGLVEDEVLTNGWALCGVLAITSLTLLCLLTLRPVRERSYEVFLLVHFVCAFIFILATFFHLRGRNITYFGVWPSMIVWGLDRFLRLLRIAVHNFGYLVPSSSSRNAPATSNLDNRNQDNENSLNATIDVLSPHFLRVTLRRPSLLTWRAGQSAYLSFPSVSGFRLEAHPFTIASIPDAEEGGTDALQAGQRKLVFFVRVRKGFTERLMNAAEPGRTYKAIVDGPYSSPPVLVGYNTVVLIAGGSGISFILPLFLDLLSRAKCTTPPCQRVVFLWAIRDAAHIQWIASTLFVALSSLPKATTSTHQGFSVSIQFHVTDSSGLSSDTASVSSETQKWADDDAEDPEKVTGHGTPSTESSSATPKLSSGERAGGLEDAVGGSLLELPYVALERGRPDLTKAIRDEIEGSAGRVSVNVCGTHALTDAVREAIRVPRPMDILRGGPTVTLHVEAFGGS